MTGQFVVDVYIKWKIVMRSSSFFIEIRENASHKSEYKGPPVTQYLLLFV